MVSRAPVPDILLVLIAFALPLALVLLVRDAYGLWAAVLFFLVLFFLLWAFASMRDWTLPARLPFIRTTSVREIFLALTLTVAALAVSWFAGLAIGRAFSDMWGILAGLCLFGILMLAVSVLRDWQ
jgi:hypothetical protein